jgi:hypothetical protein
MGEKRTIESMKNVGAITTLGLNFEASTLPGAHLCPAFSQRRKVMKFLGKNLAVIALCLGLASVGRAQTAPAAPAPATPPATGQAATPAAAPAAPAAPAPLPTPSITGPLSGIPPLVFDAGPFGKLSVNGIISGFGLAQTNAVTGDSNGQATLSNGQVWIQKTDGWFQFYVQAGAYSLPALATPFANTQSTVSNFYGPVPTAYVKLQAGKTTSILLGELPTLIGAEYTFTFQNMNIERGLLWNQENAINRGVQVNQMIGKTLTASFSWNDGFYSNRYTWLSGSLTYTKGAHALSFVGGGNVDSKSAFQSLVTPVQNTGSIYNVIYTYTKGPWIIQPYFQYTDVPTHASIGVINGASTRGGALLLSHAFKHGFSLAGRGEYISSTGTAAQQSVNLMFGPGSQGASLTATPTFQYGGFFFRGDLSWVDAAGTAPGSAFGPTGMRGNQFRAVGEIGFMFGDNIIKK